MPRMPNITDLIKKDNELIKKVNKVMLKQLKIIKEALDSTIQEIEDKKDFTKMGLLSICLRLQDAFIALHEQISKIK